MQAKLGRFDGGYMRTTPPICGTIEQVCGRQRQSGIGTHPGSPDNPEDPHLSLIDNVNLSMLRSKRFRWEIHCRMGRRLVHLFTAKLMGQLSLSIVISAK